MARAHWGNARMFGLLLPGAAADSRSEQAADKDRAVELARRLLAGGQPPSEDEARNLARQYLREMGLD